MNKLIKKYLLKFGGEQLFREIQYLYWVRNLKNGKYFESEVKILPKFIGQGDHVIDIGAHFGRYTFPLSNLVGLNGCVYSFEPVLATFNILQKIVKRLELKNVKLFNNALNEKEKTELIEIPIDEDGLEILSCSRFAADNQYVNFKDTKRYEVKSLTLDSFINSQNMPEVKFIKCDVEGAELLVFKGSQDILTEFHPVILCEIEYDHTIVFNYRPEDLVNFMYNFGYRLYANVGAQISEMSSIHEDINNYFFIYGEFHDKAL